jgi:hypothetical protein
MYCRSIISAFILVLGCLSPCWGQDPPFLPPGEEQLPPGIINVVLPGFGDQVGGGDYGLANHIPIEVVAGVKDEEKTFTPLGSSALTSAAGKIQQEESSDQQIRIVRTPEALRFSRQQSANFQVKIGDTSLIVFWIECPLRGGKWECTMTAIYPDGSHKEVYRQNLRPDGVQYLLIDPRILLDIRLSSKKEYFSLNKRFVFSISPTQIHLWRDQMPFPNRSLID